MKYFFSIASLFVAFSLYAQDANLPNNIVTRINYKLLDYSIIDASNILEGNLYEFLNSEGVKIAQELSTDELTLSDLEVKKMFPHLKIKDSVSISRLGKDVVIPPFWATFYVSVPNNKEYWKFFYELQELYPLIIFVDPPLELDYLNTPDDTLYEFQYSLSDTINNQQTINIDSAWHIETGKSFIKVGIHDSGIDHQHEDLEVLTGYRYHSNVLYDQNGVEMESFGTDQQGHGTLVAGIIGAKRNNVTGIAGIAGGDGSDSSGVSIVNLSLDLEGQITGNDIAISIIDAARYVGTYYNWSSTGASSDDTNYYFSNAAGYGIHIGNHSYKLLTTASPGVGKDIPIDTTNIDLPELPIPHCHLCREAHLFSLQNGVTNVVSRGNNFDPSDLTLPYEEIYPQNFDDTWIVTVGASGTDGKRLHAPTNTDVGEHWYSPVGLNIDLIAPGSRASIGSTRSYHYPKDSIFGKYSSFSGTSAAAPHVTGVVALLMSYWNKPCYSNINLDPADVEYILQESATHVNPNVIGYDDSTGYGRLNATKALKMIDFPTYQIIHPQDAPIIEQEVARDTISFFMADPIHPEYSGPIGSTFPIAPADFDNLYRAERIKYEYTYDFSVYRFPSSELLDVWYRPSETNTLDLVLDTFTNLNVPPQQCCPVVWDEFRIEPRAKIESYTDSTITLSGYLYHFIGKYLTETDIFSPLDPVDFWYPINPSNDSIRMAYSIYIKDTLAETRFDFPCDTITELYDQYLNHDELTQSLDFKLFPNPGHGVLNMEFPQGSQGVAIIYDITGKLINEQKVTSSKKHYQLSVQGLQNGVYFVHFENENEQLTKKWIKQ